MALTKEKIVFFADFIEKHLGIVYAEAVYFQLEQRLEKIAQYLGLKDTEALFQKAKVEGIHGDFKQYMLDVSTNNETSFFRDTSMYNSLEKEILPKLVAGANGPAGVRIWCAAASFGQEPYSVAMLVHEILTRMQKNLRVEIVATDIADHALKRCQSATYSQLEVQRGLSTQRLIQYFTKNGADQWVLKPEIANRVQFRKQNLLDSFQSLGVFNLVLCRYVLIYQDAVRKKEIVQRIEKQIQPGGYLILGASESALGLGQELQQVAYEKSIVYQRKVA